MSFEPILWRQSCLNQSVILINRKFFNKLEVSEMFCNVHFFYEMRDDVRKTILEFSKRSV
jgi:hypothetical protein